MYILICVFRTRLEKCKVLFPFTLYETTRNFTEGTVTQGAVVVFLVLEVQQRQKKTQLLVFHTLKMQLNLSEFKSQH